MYRYEFLKALHEVVRPRTYLETGIQKGRSIELSRAHSIGIDPDFGIETELQTDVHLVRTSSDEFFARRKPLAHLPKPVIDLAFIDGMHLAEYALRDFLQVERFSTPASVIVFDDMLPWEAAIASRKPSTFHWTGDVYKALEALRAHRPDLIVLDVATGGSGTAMVLCPDASRDGVMPEYDDWLESAVVPDPQDVPDRFISRTHAIEPEELLASPGWAKLPEARAAGATADEIRDLFADLAAFAR